MTHKRSQPTTTKYDTPEKRERITPYKQDDDFDKSHAYRVALRDHAAPLEQSLHTLMEYAQHKDDCAFLDVAEVDGELRSASKPCSCGLSALLTRLK